MLMETFLQSISNLLKSDSVAGEYLCYNSSEAVKVLQSCTQEENTTYCRLCSTDELCNGDYYAEVTVKGNMAYYIKRRYQTQLIQLRTR